MLISYFTEQPYSALSVDEVWALHPFDHPARRPGDNTLIHSNRFFDPVVASRLFAERIREYEVAEEAGFDGIMVNEHHNAPYCMQSRITVMSSVVNVRICWVENADRPVDPNASRASVPTAAT